MRQPIVRLLFLVLSISSPLFAIDEPLYLGPLASGGSPGCPEHPGRRSWRSEIIGAGKTKVWIAATASSLVRPCRIKASVEVQSSRSATSLALPHPEKQSFNVIDFSRDRSKLLVSTEHDFESPNEDFRSVDVGVLELANGKILWRNAWDIFGWQQCDATVEPQGFTLDGRIVIRARRSTFVPPRHPNCVQEVGLYAIDVGLSHVSRLPDATRIERYGDILKAPFEACKTDPDIVEACFSFHGRLAFYNGTPTTRIWRIGTNRILGVQTELLPEHLYMNMDWGVEAYGDFTVCPFTKKKPGEMQMVCLESAERVFYKDYR